MAISDDGQTCRQRLHGAAEHYLLSRPPLERRSLVQLVGGAWSRQCTCGGAGFRRGARLHNYFRCTTKCENVHVNLRRCKRFDIAHQFEAWHISPRPGITGEGMYSLISQHMERELAGEGVIAAFDLHALHFWHDRHF